MKTTAWLMALAAAASPLAAQQHPASHGMMQGGMMHDDMMRGMDSMMAPVMRAMAYAPQHLLREKTTDEQGNLREMVIWRVPRTRQRPDAVRYRLALIRTGKLAQPGAEHNLHNAPTASSQWQRGCG